MMVNNNITMQFQLLKKIWSTENIRSSNKDSFFVLKIIAQRSFLSFYFMLELALPVPVLVSLRSSINVSDS